uniref:SASA domain-containing protein n=1 Tax=Heterorhabditis bacteriophora TaxID=37862 RepID=A0A1I7WMM5_HETBA
MRLRVFFAFLTYLTITLTAPQCAFYCFVNPTAKEVLDISQYRNLPCTHFVYGFAELKDEITLKDITVNDHMAAMSIGNLRRFLGRFDGIFIHIEGSQLASSACSLFLGAISTASASLPCLPTLGLSSRWMWRAANRLRDLSDHVEHMYLMMEELPSSEDPYSVTHIDPLHQSESIPIEDSISGCTHKMMESGVPAEKIVVGLSCGAKTYTVHDPSAAMHGGFAMKAGVRRSWQDICGNNGTLLDKTSASLTIEMKTSWTSANSPELNTLGRKISWISQEGFGGIGFSSLQWDDPSNKCGNGPFPTHSMVNKFSDVVKATANTINLLKRIDQWRAEIGESAPKVILSIGAQQTNDVWRVELANSWKRQQLVKSIENHNGLHCATFTSFPLTSTDIYGTPLTYVPTQSQNDCGRSRKSLDGQWDTKVEQYLLNS